MNKKILPINFRIVLVEPEIPQNTGNIGRTCVGTNCELNLVKPYGFEISDRTLKRAGLDYWQHLQWNQYENWKDWETQVSQPQRHFFLSTKADQSFYDLEIQPNDIFVFGKETKGLPPLILQKHPEQLFKIPMLGPIRSLNLATSVAVVIYEGLRQIEIA